MVQIPHRPQLGGLLPKPLKGAPSLLGGALQSAKNRAQSALSKIKGGPLRTDPLLEQYLELLMSDGPDGERLRAQLIAAGRAELDRRQSLIQPLQKALIPFQAPGTRSAFASQVLGPADRKQISGPDAWAAADRLVTSTGLDKLVSGALDPATSKGTAFQFMRWADSVFGPLAFSLGMGGEGGFGVGFEGGLSISGLRYKCVVVTKSETVAFGAYAELAASFQAGVSKGPPAAGMALGVDVSFGYAYGVAGEVTISFQPVLHAPTLKPDKNKMWTNKDFLTKDKEDNTVLNTGAIFGGTVHQGFVVDYVFSGLSLSLGVGMGGKAGALGVTLSTSYLLPGVVG